MVTKVETGQKTVQKIIKIFHTGKDHVLNIKLSVTLVIPFIFAFIQAVKTGLFGKTNSVSFM